MKCCISVYYLESIIQVHSELIVDMHGNGMEISVLSDLLEYEYQSWLFVTIVSQTSLMINDPFIIIRLTM
jgi:hypothetical protein